MGEIPVVITASKRDSHHQRRTLKTTVDAGFSDIHASCEPETDVAAFSPAKIHQNAEQLGQWRNFIRALAIGLTTGAEYFVTLEDDVELCRDTLQLIRRDDWPSEDCGCVQLHSPFKYAAFGDYVSGRRNQLHRKDALDMLGCCALLFRRDAAQVLVDWARDKGWRGDTKAIIHEPVNKKGGDTFVGEVLTFLGFTIWFYNPSIANHIGAESTLGGSEGHIKSANRLTLKFPGVGTDLASIFSGDRQIPS